MLVSLVGFKASPLAQVHLSTESQSISGLLKWPQVTQMEMVLLLDIASRLVSIHVNNCRPLRLRFLCLCDFSYALFKFSEEK